MGAHISSNEVEAANRAEVTALLVREGYRVYRPEADTDGEDLVLRTPAPGRKLITVQLKSRLTVDELKYGPLAELWILFPECPFKAGYQRTWYLVPHRKIFEKMHEDHGHTQKWNGKWSMATVPRELRAYLKAYMVCPNADGG